MSEILPRFAAPLLDRLPEGAEERAVRLVLELAAAVWNAAVVGEDVDSEALGVGAATAA